MPKFPLNEEKDSFSLLTQLSNEGLLKRLKKNNINEVDVLNSKKKYIGTVYLNDVMASIINPIDEP